MKRTLDMVFVKCISDNYNSDKCPYVPYKLLVWDKIKVDDKYSILGARNITVRTDELCLMATELRIFNFPLFSIFRENQESLVSRKYYENAKQRELG